MRSALPLPARREGKARDVYRIPARAGEPPRLLVIATDRISAFDVVMPTPIPGKGRILTELSLFWFRFLRRRSICRDHLVDDRVDSIPGLDDSMRRALSGRSMICREARVVPIECVVRGYLAGSGWREYRQTREVCGVKLPAGLELASRLPEPIFTPATKASVGHDENITFEAAARDVGAATMHQLRDWSISLYRAAAEHARARGVILADTKFEFGHALDDGELILIDEVLTPDSSRYWPVDRWQPGADPPSFDKQFLRDWLLELESRGEWNRMPPGPELPAPIVEQTLSRYREALKRLTAPAPPAAPES